MTSHDITTTIKSHAFDLSKYNTDIISDKLNAKAADYLYAQYTDLICHHREGNYVACESLINTLKHSGYYVNTDSINRIKTIESIIKPNTDNDSVQDELSGNIEFDNI
jgi:hypothetical protein